MDREQSINEALARGLGWESRIHPQAHEGWQGVHWIDTKGYSRNNVPNYCGSWSAMGELVEAMRGKGWVYEVVGSPAHRQDGKLYPLQPDPLPPIKATLALDREPWTWAEKRADTAPMAVAMAALAALGVAVPGEGEERMATEDKRLPTTAEIYGSCPDMAETMGQTIDRLTAENADLRRQLTQHVDWLNERNEQVADLKRQVAEARERAEKAERAFALQRVTCETESFREQIRSQLIRDGIEAQATIAQQGETIAALRGAAHRPLPDHGWTCTICRQPLQYVMAGEKVIPREDGTAVVVCPACVDRAVRDALDAGKETRNG
jgi:hypothetical protein